MSSMRFTFLRCIPGILAIALDRTATVTLDFRNSMC